MAKQMDDRNLIVSDEPDWGKVIWIVSDVRCASCVPAAAYCAVSAPTGSWLWLRVQSSCSVLLVPAILCQCQSCSQASSLSQHGGKPGLAAEQAALGGQAAEADIAEWSPAWPEESTVESGESQWRWETPSRETGHCQWVRVWGSEVCSAHWTQHTLATPCTVTQTRGDPWERWQWWPWPGAPPPGHLASGPPSPASSDACGDGDQWPQPAPFEKCVFQRILEQSESNTRHQVQARVGQD